MPSLFDRYFLKTLPPKNRFIAAIGMVLICGFLTVSLISYHSASRSLRKSLTDDILPLTGDNIYSEIQKDLIRLIFISSMMATDTFLRDWVINGEKDADQITKYLGEIQDKYNTITSFFVSESSRTYYHSDGILKQVKEEEERDQWYFRVRKMNAPYEINVDFDMANDDAMTIFINYRVLDYSGNYIGTTGCGLTVTTVRALLEDYAKRYHRTIYFTDPKGKITLTSTTNRPPFSSLKQVSELSELKLTPVGSRSTDFAYTRDEENILINTRYIKELGWYLFVEQSLQQNTSRIRWILIENLGISFLICTVILFAVYTVINVYQGKLEAMATTDKLTGLTNRNAFEILFAQSLREAQRSADPLSVILLDLDHFKGINDRYGHPAGDAVLRSTATTIRSSVREADTVCRWGGEEFLLLLKDCSIDNAGQLAEKIRCSIEESSIRFDNQTIRTQASFGVAQCIPGEALDRLLIRVDKALYRAKKNGRNRTEKAAGMEPPP